MMYRLEQWAKNGQSVEIYIFFPSFLLATNYAEIQNNPGS